MCCHCTVLYSSCGMVWYDVLLMCCQLRRALRMRWVSGLLRCAVDVQCVGVVPSGGWDVWMPFAHTWPTHPTPHPQVLYFGRNHVNSAVVLATARLFLRYTLAFPEQHRQVGVGGVGGRQAGVPARVWGQVYLGVYAVKRESAAKRAPAAGLDPRIADPVPASNLKRAPQTVPAPCLAPGTPCLQPCCPCLPACLQPPLRCPWLLQVVEELMSISDGQAVLLWERDAPTGGVRLNPQASVSRIGSITRPVRLLITSTVPSDGSRCSASAIRRAASARARMSSMGPWSHVGTGVLP